MSDDDIHGISGAYAVDAVDDVERVRFNAHLGGCPACKSEVKSLQAAATELSLVKPVSPPASLRSSIMLSISQVRPLPPVVAPPALPTSLDTSASPTSLDTSASPTLLDARRTERASRSQRARRDPVRWLVGVAAAALIVTGGAVWHPWSPGQEQGSPQLTATQQVLQAKDAQRFEKRVGSSTATVVRSNSLKKAVILTANLPAIPKGKVYELWLLQDEKMVKAGFLPHTPTNTVLLQGDATTAAGAGITVEPAGGSPTPSQSPVVRIDFA